MLDRKRQQNAFAVLSGTVESPMQEEARKLYDAGLNVFPQPLGEKAGYPWKKLQYGRLHRTHYKYGLHALFAEQCNLAVMCGRTSNDLFVIDCESRTQFEYHIEQVRQHGYPLWTVETARGGHIYLLSTKGEIENVPPGKIPDTEIRGKGYVIAPPSIHPSGVIYQWKHREGDYPPALDPTKIDWLKDYAGNKIELKSKRHKKQLSTPQSYNPLSQKTQDYLLNGAALTEGTRNSRLFEAACDLHGNNYTQQDAYNTLLPIAKSSGLRTNEITSTIDSAFSRPRTPSKTQRTAPAAAPTGSTSHNAEAAVAYTQNHKWTGRTGNTDRAVMLALAERSHIGGNENGTFRASIREVAALSRVSRETAHKSIKRLKDKKLIRHAGSDETSKAGLWRFGDAIFKDQPKKSRPSNWDTNTNWLSSSVLVSRSDALERGALGQSGMRVYRALIAGGTMLPKALAAAAALTVGQAEYGLLKLREYDLVERLPEGWRAIPATDAQLDERVALVAGTLGKGEARRQRYIHERSLFAGQEIFAARLRMDPHFLAYRRSEMSTAMTESGQSGQQNQPEIERAVTAADDDHTVESARVPLWRCPNCGQHHFGDDPPDMCAYCADFTTWRRVDGDADGDSIMVEKLSPPKSNSKKPK